MTIWKVAFAVLKLNALERGEKRRVREGERRKEKGESGKEKVERRKSKIITRILAYAPWDLRWVQPSLRCTNYAFSKLSWSMYVALSGEEC
jgi:hypothetical protein